MKIQESASMEDAKTHLDPTSACAFLGILYLKIGHFVVISMNVPTLKLVKMVDATIWKEHINVFAILDIN